MAGRRIERLNEQLKRELTDVLYTSVRDPRIGHVTVTEVRATPDLDHARVFVTGMGTEPDRQASLEGLEAAATWIRRELGQRLHIRRVPELSFEWDATLEHARRIERLLDEVRPRPDDASKRAGGDAEDASE